MGVFSKVGNFLNRHRNKLIAGGALIGGSVLLVRWAQRRLFEWQQNEARELFERTRKRQHFESTERTCDKTIVSLTGALCDALERAIDTESPLAEIRSCDDPRQRLELWQRLGTLVFAKATCLAYANALLVVALRVQLNVLGGFLYRDVCLLSQARQQRYLSLCHGLIDRGVDEIAAVLKQHYEPILANIPLKKAMRLSDVENVFWAVREAIKDAGQDPIDDFAQYFTDTWDEGNSSTSSEEADLYRSMIFDTLDLLKSEEVRRLAASCVSRSFVLLADKISEFYTPEVAVVPPSPSASSNDKFVHPFTARVPLARLFPIVGGLSSRQGALQEALVQLLTTDEKVKTLGANVYESFSSDNNNY